MTERAVFLDRDGTIVEDVGYLGDCDKVRFLPGVIEAIKRLNAKGFKVIITTNQAGVAKGHFTEETLKEINIYIEGSLAERGAFIDKTYYCPHHIEGIVEEYKKECDYRKPNPGMIEKAAGDFNIDLKNSFAIGDKTTDIEAGHRAGCRTILLRDKVSPSDANETGVVPDHIAPSLYEAVKLIVELSDQINR